MSNWGLGQEDPIEPKWNESPLVVLGKSELNNKGPSLAIELPELMIEFGLVKEDGVLFYQVHASEDKVIASPYHDVISERYGFAKKRGAEGEEVRFPKEWCAEGRRDNEEMKSYPTGTEFTILATENMLNRANPLFYIVSTDETKDLRSKVDQPVVLWTNEKVSTEWSYELTHRRIRVFENPADKTPKKIVKVPVDWEWVPYETIESGSDVEEFIIE